MSEPDVQVEACPVCDQDNEPMGFLGRLAHFRCRACGMMYNVPRETPQAQAAQ